MTLLTLGPRRRWDGEISVPAASATPTLTYVGTTATTLLSDGYYNSFPGAVTCPNGNVLIAWRQGTSHTADGDLYTMRSTDGGSTWGTPTLVAAATESYSYGTATLSLVGTHVALVSWVRSSGAPPSGEATRIFLSDDNGLTWDAPVTVTTGIAGLRFTVAESPLVYRGGWYYLGVWGTDSAVNGYYKSAVVRSPDLYTWQTVAIFDSGATLGFNESGVADFGTHLVCVIRHETDGRYTSISEDGYHWTAPELVSTGGTGAPKMAQDVVQGVNIFPLRTGPYDSGGNAFMAGVDAGGHWHDLGPVYGGQAFMYGQTVPLAGGAGGVVYSGETSTNTANLYWRPFTVTAP